MKDFFLMHLIVGEVNMNGPASPPEPKWVFIGPLAEMIKWKIKISWPHLDFNTAKAASHSKELFF